MNADLLYWNLNIYDGQGLRNSILFPLRFPLAGVVVEPNFALLRSSFYFYFSSFKLCFFSSILCMFARCLRFAVNGLTASWV